MLKAEINNVELEIEELENEYEGIGAISQKSYDSMSLLKESP